MCFLVAAWIDLLQAASILIQTYGRPNPQSLAKTSISTKAKRKLILQEVLKSITLVVIKIVSNTSKNKKGRKVRLNRKIILMLGPLLTPNQLEYNSNKKWGLFKRNKERSLSR